MANTPNFGIPGNGAARNGVSAFAPDYSPTRSQRLAGGLSTLGKGILGYADAEKNRKISGNDYMNQAYAVGLSDVQNRANAYQDRYNDTYNKLADRPNLVRDSQQENARAAMLRQYLSSYGGNIGKLAGNIPSADQLKLRQGEDLRNRTFMDATYLPTDMFNEFYGLEGQNQFAEMMGLPLNGLSQSSANGGRQINNRMNDEFDSGITNSNKLNELIMNNLQQNSRTASNKTLMDRIGIGAGLGSAILGMM